MTSIRSYFGSKVSIWTNTGTLVVSQDVSGPNGSWTETQLAQPVLLTANTAYRLVDYTNGETAYYGDRTTQSSLVTVGQTLEFPGDRFPSITDNRFWMVDLRGDFGTFSTITTNPTMATFVNGVWNGSVAVGQIVSNMRLRVDAAGGMGGESNLFNVVTGTPTPQMPALLAVSDSGRFDNDLITNLNNSGTTKKLQFSVGGTVPGAKVDIIRNGAIIGTATADDTTTIVTTNGTTFLPDGNQSFLSRQTIGVNPSLDSAATVVVIDTAAPGAPSSLDLQAASDSSVSSSDNFTKNRSLGFDLFASEPGILRMEYDGSNGTGPRIRINSAGTYSQNLGTLTTGFLGTQTYAAASQPEMVATGDINNDGFADVIVDNFSAGSLFIYLANPDGTLQAPTSLSPPSAPAQPVLADFNHDGNLDLAVKGTTIAFYLGNGDGTFQSPLSLAGGSGFYIAAADVNGDNELDLVANGGGSTVNVFLGNGNGTLQALVTYTVGSSPFGIAAADLNGDGRLDLVCADAGSNNISVLLGATGPLADGEHTFSAQMEDLAGNRSPFSDVLTVTIDNAAPAAPTGQYIFETGPALKLTFAEPVALDNSALVLSDLSHGGTAGTALDLASSFATFTFTAPNGILPDGNYHAHIAAGAFSDLAGNASTDEFDFDFYVLGGDANRDRTVDLSDMIMFADNWFTSGKTFSQGDFNYDGTVNAKDLTIVAHNWQVTLDAPATPAAPNLSLVAIVSTAPVNAPAPNVVEQPPAAASKAEQPAQASPPVIAQPAILAEIPKPVSQPAAPQPIVQPPVIPLVQKPVQKPVVVAAVKHTTIKPAVKKPAVQTVKKAAVKPIVKKTAVAKASKQKKRSTNAIATLHAPPAVKVKKSIAGSARNGLLGLLPGK
ncbi:MAG TPA: FG-GAP-like repeat-containing protein [Tepidisphaeraceae bacterium]|nr:FG-GAP-like repeat-containing protein [Tepidisphaeraceae bacterium]